MKFLTIFLIIVVLFSGLISATANKEKCESCKNAIKTVDSKLPGKRSREMVENYLTQACTQVTGVAPLPQLPVQLPLPVCSLPTVHRSEIVQGLLEKKEYTSICKNANLC
ncbi:hypothetical protein DICPUDRAFT_150220 [Dictyostelium purpureum]|uniref:Saposin B-type domain-containing protein n=1 Tax=Dictyostelium purpureum TaxID=5786 RepID=F0ZFR9_DICPU|nr:uncharacterized protein DICPUDRAFT_150220 [Dictyostelium purpureum]EGC37203.1 hypothetical protein DICPUDRAFT_150220 [Dictyostelium purpureum]|eukprot:XP_003286254.1 hypothetical protein DICPUDRAFT_150220 [Dictyostelium purpureum]